MLLQNLNVEHKLKKILTSQNQGAVKNEELHSSVRACVFQKRPRLFCRLQSAPLTELLNH